MNLKILDKGWYILEADFQSANADKQRKCDSNHRKYRKGTVFYFGVNDHERYLCNRLHIITDCDVIHEIAPHLKKAKDIPISEYLHRYWPGPLESFIEELVNKGILSEAQIIETVKERLGGDYEW